MKIKLSAKKVVGNSQSLFCKKDGVKMTYKAKGFGTRKIDKAKFVDCLNLFSQRAITVSEIAKVLGVSHNTARDRVEKSLEIIYRNGGGSISPDLFPSQWFTDTEAS